jgi:hypothetical protein
MTDITKVEDEKSDKHPEDRSLAGELPSPKRGAFPSPKEGREEAKPYIPDSDSETSRPPDKPDSPIADDEGEKG